MRYATKIMIIVMIIVIIIIIIIMIVIARITRITIMIVITIMIITIIAPQKRSSAPAAAGFQTGSGQDVFGWYVICFWYACVCVCVCCVCLCLCLYGMIFEERWLPDGVGTTHCLFCFGGKTCSREEAGSRGCAQEDTVRVLKWRST